MRKTFVQGGSVKVFLIVGIILSIAALAVLYFAGRQAISGQVPPMFVPESSQGDSKDEANDSVDSDSDKSKDDATKEDDKSAADNQGSDAEKTRIVMPERPMKRVGLRRLTIRRLARILVRHLPKLRARVRPLYLRVDLAMAYCRPLRP